MLEAAFPESQCSKSHVFKPHILQSSTWRSKGETWGLLRGVILLSLPVWGFSNFRRRPIYASPDHC
jgi:hypothetical protein